MDEQRGIAGGQFFDQPDGFQEAFRRITGTIDQWHHLHAFDTQIPSPGAFHTTVEAENGSDAGPRYGDRVAGVEVIADPNFVGDAVQGQ